MAKGNKKWLYIFGIAAFIIYIFAAPRSIPVETVLSPRWITSLESNYPISFVDISPDENELLLPFILGNRFGYLGDDGKFAINQIMNGYVSLSKNSWVMRKFLLSKIQKAILCFWTIEISLWEASKIPSPP